MKRKTYFSVLFWAAAWCCCFASLSVAGPLPAAQSKTPPPAAAAVNPEEQEIQEKLKNADGYLRARNYAKAEELYREAYLSAKKGPLSEKALFHIGKADFHLKRYNEARLNIKRLIGSYSQSTYVNEAYLLLGYISLNSQKPKEAQTFFDKVGAPLEDKANIARAEAALKLDNAAGAEAFLSKVSRKTAETSPRAVYVRAMLLSRKGMHREAVSAIQKIMEPTLKEEDIRFEKALILYNASKINDAAKVCAAVLAEPLSNFEKTNTKKLLVNIYDFQGRTEEALKIGLEIMPHEVDDAFKMKIVRLYEKKGDTGGALRYLNFLQDKGVKTAEMEKRIKGLTESKDPGSMDYVLKSSSYIHQDSRIIVDVARYLIANKKKLEGMILLRRAMRGSEKGEASLYLAELLAGEGKLNEAKRALDPLLLDTRYFFRGSYLMAEVLRREGNYALAIEYLAKAARYSKDARISSLLADLYCDTGDRTNALKYYLAASHSGDGLASVKAGDFFYLSGDRNKSLSYYKRALELGVSDRKNLQWLQYQYGKMTGSREYLKKAAESGGIVGDAARILAARE